MKLKFFGRGPVWALRRFAKPFVTGSIPATASKIWYLSRYNFGRLIGEMIVRLFQWAEGGPWGVITAGMYQGVFGGLRADPDEIERKAAALVRLHHQAHVDALTKLTETTDKLIACQREIEQVKANRGPEPAKESRLMSATYFYPYEIAKTQDHSAFEKGDLRKVFSQDQLIRLLLVCCQCGRTWPSCACPENERQHAEQMDVLLGQFPCVQQERQCRAAYISSGGDKYSVTQYAKFRESYRPAPASGLITPIAQSTKP